MLPEIKSWVSVSISKPWKCIGISSRVCKQLHHDLTQISSVSSGKNSYMVSLTYSPNGILRSWWTCSKKLY